MILGGTNFDTSPVRYFHGVMDVKKHPNWNGTMNGIPDSIDMALIRGVDQCETRQELIRSMIRLCKNLDCQVVAEGIETPAEHETLEDLGCDLLQGFLFARPSPGFIEISGDE